MPKEARAAKLVEERKVPGRVLTKEA